MDVFQELYLFCLMLFFLKEKNRGILVDAFMNRKCLFRVINKKEQNLMFMKTMYQKRHIIRNVYYERNEKWKNEIKFKIMDVSIRKRYAQKSRVCRKPKCQRM